MAAAGFKAVVVVVWAHLGHVHGYFSSLFRLYISRRGLYFAGTFWFLMGTCRGGGRREWHMLRIQKWSAKETVVAAGVTSLVGYSIVYSARAGLEVDRYAPTRFWRRMASADSAGVKLTSHELSCEATKAFICAEFLSFPKKIIL